MAIELINIGNIANDGTGDELRVAFRKINENFVSVDDSIAAINANIGDIDGLNLGTGAEIFVEKDSNYDLLFRSLVAGNFIEITQNPASIEIAALPLTTPIISDSGSTTLTPGVGVRIFGGKDISTTVDPITDAIIINSDKLTSLSEDTSPELSANLDAQLNSINNVFQITADDIYAGRFFGTLFGQINGVDLNKVNNFFEEFDFGSLNPNVTSFYEYVILGIAVDLGTITDPSSVNIDFGTIV